MGVGVSAEQEQSLVSEFFQLAQSSQKLPDISIDDSLLKFSGLDSASVLDAYSAQLITDLGSKHQGYMKDLASSTFTHIPNAVGLGALIISLLLDSTVNGFIMFERDDTMGMENPKYFTLYIREDLHSRVSMMDYMVLFLFNMHNPEALLEKFKQKEVQLSDHLTQLKNSMLKDNQMSSSSMKQWTNDAALHLQMLIHIARLEMAKRAQSEAEINEQVLSVSNMTEHYENDLQNLLANYKTYKRSTIYSKPSLAVMFERNGVVVCEIINCKVHDTELNIEISFKNTLGESECKPLANQYLDYMFNNWNQPKELREYFHGVKQNLREVIMQNSTFDIQKFLPGSRKEK